MSVMRTMSGAAKPANVPAAATGSTSTTLPANVNCSVAWLIGAIVMSPPVAGSLSGVGSCAAMRTSGTATTASPTPSFAPIPAISSLQKTTPGVVSRKKNTSDYFDDSNKTTPGVISYV